MHIGFLGVKSAPIVTVTMSEKPRLGEHPEPKSAWQRLTWFVLLWAVGAGFLWLVSLVLRRVLLPD
jgi:hypothetical protein